MVSVKLLLLFVILDCVMASKKKVDISLLDIDEVPGFTAAWNEVEAVLREACVPGLVLTVVQRKENSYNVWSKTYGVPDITKPNTPVSFQDDQFAIGSVSKTFAVGLLGILLTEHSKKYPMGWKTKVKDIMGNSFSILPSIQNRITLRVILSHASGTNRYTSFLTMGLERRAIGEYCRRMKLLDGTGRFDHYYYNNLMYLLVECIIEKIGNDTYANLLKKKIFEPLGMMNSAIIRQKVDSNFQGVAMMYYRNASNSALISLDIQLLRLAEMISAAGGVLSTGFDMSKWLMFHLENGKTLSGQQLVDPHLWNEMHSRVLVSKESSGKADKVVVGLSWHLENYRDVTISQHGGRIAGFDSKVTLAIGKRFGIFTSANGPAQISYSYQNVLHDMFYDIFHNQVPQPLWPNVTSKSQLKDHTTPVENVDAYLGTYGHTFFGNVTISGQPGSLNFQYGLFGKGSLIPTEDTTFSPVMGGALDYYNFMLGPVSHMFEITFADLNLNGRFETLQIWNEESSVTFGRNHMWDNYDKDAREAFADLIPVADTSAACATSPSALLLAVTLLIKTKLLL